MSNTKPKIVEHEWASTTQNCKILENLSAGNVTVTKFPNWEVARRELMNAQELFGSVVPHKHSDNFVDLNSSVNSNVRRPQNSSNTQSAHTDGCYMEKPPGIVAMFCDANSKIGGTSTFVSCLPAINKIVEQFGVNTLGLLSLNNCYTTFRGEQSLTKTFVKNF